MALKKIKNKIYIDFFQNRIVIFMKKLYFLLIYKFFKIFFRYFNKNQVLLKLKNPFFSQYCMPTHFIGPTLVNNIGNLAKLSKNRVGPIIKKLLGQRCCMTLDQ